MAMPIWPTRVSSAYWKERGTLSTTKKGQKKFIEAASASAAPPNANDSLHVRGTRAWASRPARKANRHQGIGVSRLADSSATIHVAWLSGEFEYTRSPWTRRDSKVNA